MEKIRTNNHGYSIVKEDDIYYIYDGDIILKTPGRNDVCTGHLELANRILDDLDKYGYDYTNIDCILAWHFTTIDNFSRMDAETQVAILMDSFFGYGKEDWTFTDVPTNPVDSINWRAMFGNGSQEYMEKISSWLSKCSLMQRVAACCVGNAYASLNLAYVFARHLELTSDEDLDESFKSFAEFLENNNPYNSAEEFINAFNTFKLYYGIDLKERGKIIVK